MARSPPTCRLGAQKFEHAGGVSGMYCLAMDMPGVGGGAAGAGAVRGTPSAASQPAPAPAAGDAVASCAVAPRASQVSTVSTDAGEQVGHFSSMVPLNSDGPAEGAEAQGDADSGGSHGSRDGGPAAEGRGAEHKSQPPPMPVKWKPKTASCGPALPIEASVAKRYAAGGVFRCLPRACFAPSRTGDEALLPVGAPVRDRCLADVRPGSACHARMPVDRPILFVGLDGLLMSCMQISAGSQLAEKVVGDFDWHKMKLKGQDAYARVRPHACEFLVSMKCEAGLSVAVYTANPFETAVAKVSLLEAAFDSFEFDFVIHGGTYGAWTQGRKLKSLHRFLGVESAFLIEDQRLEGQRRKGDPRSISTEEVAYVETFGPFVFDMASGRWVQQRVADRLSSKAQADADDLVFKDFELENATFRSWLVSAAVGHTTFVERLLQAEPSDEAQDGEQPIMKQRTQSAMSLNGIDLEAKVEPPELLRTISEEEAEVGTPGGGAGGPSLMRKGSRHRSFTPRRSISRQRSPSGSFDDSASVVTQGSRASRMSRLLRRAASGISTLGKRNVKPSFHGHWVCVGTWGLDEFLRANKISTMQRMAAMKAPWPTWEFQQDGGRVVFINHSFLGDIREEFEIDGPEYTAVDGKRQKLQCKAFWENETMVIERSGPQGKFREARSIDAEGKLQFKLTGIDSSIGVSWGRTFERK